MRIDLDEEAFLKWKEGNGLNPDLTIEQVHQIMAEGEEAQSKSLFPGEKQKMLLSPDKLIMAFAPQPTRMPYECLPRYMMRLQTIDLDESVTQCIDESFLKYMEGKTIRLTGDLSSQKTIWLKPRVTAP